MFIFYSQNKYKILIFNTINNYLYKKEMNRYLKQMLI